MYNHEKFQELNCIIFGWKYASNRVTVEITFLG